MAVLHANYLVARESGQGAVSYTFAPGVPFEINAVKFHIPNGNGGVSENFTITADSPNGWKYDTLYLSQDMLTTQHIVWIPDQPIPFQSDEIIVIEYANTNNYFYGLEIFYRETD